MTREEAMKELSYIIDEMPSECADWIDAISMGIKALEQEPCTDAISRQAVLDLPKNTERGFGGKILEQSIDIEYIKALPPVTPAEKVGEWIYEKRKRLVNETDEGPEYRIDYWCKCSKCGGDFGYRKMEDAFCKYCGAKMGGTQHD